VNNLKIVVGTLAIAAALGMTSAQATSVSSGGGVNNLVTQAAAPVAAAQTASIVAGNVAGSVSGSVGGAVSAPGASAPQSFNLREIMKGQGAQAGAMRGMNAWVSGGYTSIDANDRGGEFDGNVVNVNIGLDAKLTDRFVLGLTAGYENLDVDTTFNSGTFEGDGYSVGPYVAFRLTDNWTLLGLATYTWLEYDTRNGNTAVTGSFDAERITASAGLSGNFRHNSWVIGPQAGVLFVNEEQDDYRQSNGTAVRGDNIPLVRWSLGSTLGYDFGKFVPYGKLVGEYDSTHSAAVDLGNGIKSSNDRLGAVVGAGVNLPLGPTTSANVEGTYNTLGRENLDVYSIKARFSLAF
jgi:outer membrane autotransporter protein